MAVKALLVFLSGVGIWGWTSAVAACSPTPEYEAPSPDVSKEEALTGFALIGAGTMAGSVAVANGLDRSDRYPTLIPILISAPLVAYSSWEMTPGKGIVSSDCEFSMTYGEFARRAWIPAVLGVVPATLTFWFSDATTSFSAVTATLESNGAGLRLRGHF
ncbi:MAG TPA: hypothetical protein VI197_28290 [Polyangiaceae bacterium]